MPRSSSGVFHAVSRPCVPVNTPPSGGPTSSPKMSVTPSRDSPTWSAMRIAWIIVAISVLPGHDVLVREHVVPDRLRIRVWLAAYALRCLGELVRVRVAQLLDLRARDQLAILELLLPDVEAVDLVLREVRAARRRVPAQPRHHRLEQVRLPLGAHVVDRLLQRRVARLGIVAVDDRRRHAE